MLPQPPPSESATGCLLKCFNHEKGGNKPARHRLQRLVRRRGSRRLPSVRILSSMSPPRCREPCARMPSHNREIRRHYQGRPLWCSRIAHGSDNANARFREVRAGCAGSLECAVRHSNRRVDPCSELFVGGGVGTGINLC